MGVLNWRFVHFWIYSTWRVGFLGGKRGPERAVIPTQGLKPEASTGQRASQLLSYLLITGMYDSFLFFFAFIKLNVFNSIE